ncbi:MAG TPA: HD domain-containing protein, partial [Thermoleophilaceae bacterium]|nr:HD domain-containing protein [Thermoleophilaceae bacterium]
MEQQSLSVSKVFVRDLADGQSVDSVFVVRERTRRQKKNGEAFLKLQLGDVTGAVEAVLWERVEELSEHCCPGGVVRVLGTFSVDPKYGSSLTVRALRPAEAGEYEACDLEEGPARSVEQMEEGLRELVGMTQNPFLRELLERFFGESSSVWTRWREAPAAKRYHQAYKHGLLEHCLSVAQGVHSLCGTFPEIDRELAVAGALLHDIGKIEAYAVENGAIELTDAGKLQGEIALGYYLVRSEIERIQGFPEHTAEGLLHIILSHHGQLEHGSPVVPCTREATLVHMVDNLGGKLGSFDRLEKSLADGERWSG